MYKKRFGMNNQQFLIYDKIHPNTSLEKQTLDTFLAKNRISFL